MSDRGLGPHAAVRYGWSLIDDAARCELSYRGTWQRLSGGPVFMVDAIRFIDPAAEPARLVRSVLTARGPRPGGSIALHDLSVQ